MTQLVKLINPVVFYSFALFVSLHCISFIFEMIYQKMCYPITFSGFITSMFSQTSYVCTLIRAVSTRAHCVLYDVVLFTFLASFTQLNHVINKYKRYVHT